MFCDFIVPSIYTPSNQALLTYGNTGHWFEINGKTLCFISGSFCFFIIGFNFFMLDINHRDKANFKKSHQSSSFTDNNDMLQRVRLLPA